MELIELSFTLNGESVTRRVSAEARLLDVLRVDCGATGTKEGCGEGECGACSVVMDGLLVNSCLVPAFQAHGTRIETAEGTNADVADVLNRAGASQCGACTPGIVMAMRWLRSQPGLSAHVDLREYMSGNLCRCTGYDGVIQGLRDLLTKPCPSGKKPS